MRVFKLLDIRELLPGTRLTAALFCLCVTSVVHAEVQKIAGVQWTVESVQEGRRWIEKMSRSMQDVTYAGTFVYLHDAEVESMRIYHRKVDGVEHERLSSLNGEAREIVRNADNVVCLWPGSKSVIVSKTQPRSPFPQFDPDKLIELESFYRFSKMGSERVAGRETEVIDITPLDSYRYGYRLWVDKKNFMLLRSAMSNSLGQVIEQVMFTDISYPTDIPGEMFELSASGLKQSSLAKGISLPEAPVVDTDLPGIATLSLPGGFALVSSKVITSVASTDFTVRRLMYSDGLASLSVFIADASDNSVGRVLNGATAMGAVHAYGVTRDKWHATVVGEVPHATVKMLAESVELAIY